MAQPAITSFFNTRKRAAAETLVGSKHKLMRTDSTDSSNLSPINAHVNEIGKDLPAVQPAIDTRKIFSPKIDTENGKLQRRSSSTAKRARTRKHETPQTDKLSMERVDERETRKRPHNSNIALLEAEMKLSNVDRGMKTPTKAEQLTSLETVKRANSRRKLSLDEIKTKLVKSDKLGRLKESLNKINQLEKTRQAIQEKNSTIQSDAIFESKSPSLKHFQSIQLEVLTSPKKQHGTPIKLAPHKESPQKSSTDLLMSPKKTVPTQVFSPTKSLPAYKAFQYLAERPGSTLQLPYKYRCLIELFKCLDAVCAMFFNRKEIITMKKLKPAVQRMLRKNFSETHLAQIKQIYPESYSFAQRKMLNAGSHTKYDYYQLVIAPNVEEDMIDKGNKTDDKVLSPQILLERQRRITDILLNKVKAEHDIFLRSLNPPMIIPPNKITRWHPDFDLQNCPDVERATLPDPPNIERFSSAKDVLSTARNLFNTSSPSVGRLTTVITAATAEGSPGNLNSIYTPPTTPSAAGERIKNPIDSVLKGVPKSLLDRIREKQAARTLENLTRRPSQDQEFNKFNKLPELARHLRNIFITENKGALELDIVLNKIENSYREKIPRAELKDLLQLLSKELDGKWLTFHHLRKTDYLKINKNSNLTEIIANLQKKAEAKLHKDN